MTDVKLIAQMMITMEKSIVCVPGYRCIPALLFNISMACDAAIHTVASLKCFPLIPGDILASNSPCTQTHLHQFSLSLPLHVLNNPSFQISFLSLFPLPSSIYPTIQQAPTYTHRVTQVIVHCVILPFQPSIALHRPLSQPRKSTKAPALQTARPNPISASIWLHYRSGFPL